MNKCHINKIFLILISIILFSCSPSQESIRQKFDQSLFDIVNQNEQDINYDLIKFIGKCEVRPSYEMKKEIDYTGVSVEKFADKTFRALGTYEQIKRVAQLSFVYHLELSK